MASALPLPVVNFPPPSRRRAPSVPLLPPPAKPVGAASESPAGDPGRCSACAGSGDLAYCRSLDGRILEANLSFARKFGQTSRALKDASVASLVHPDDAHSLQSTLHDLVRPPHRAVAEHRWLTPQGVRWMAWEETALLDAAGALSAIHAVGRDITRQRLAEEQFYRLSRAVEQSPVSIVITDLEGRAQYVNAKFIAVTGHTLEDILDRNLDVLREGHADQASYEACWSAIRAGGEWRGELATSRPNAGPLWESVKVSCLRGPGGEVTNFLCLREDITERKQLESQLRQAHKMESLGTLAGGIAHDFNNVLAIILGYAEFCQDAGACPAVQEKGFREIHRAAERARTLVRQILTFSRKTEVRFVAVDLNQLARELVELMTQTFPRTVAFQLDLEEKLPALFADQSQLQQIVLNLCVNGRDAMAAGGTITLSTRVCAGGALPAGATADPARDYACLRVTDTGIGMSAAVRQRIFEPFFTTKQGRGGTGLGLAVVYGIVVAHHGCIEVESTPGAGSTFSVFLPLTANAVIAAAPSVTREFPGGRESLLVVDDEESLRSLLGAALSDKGYTTTMAASGLEAIACLSDSGRHFDAVLLDVNMPGASGIDVLKVIRCCRPGLKVIVITGHMTPEARAELEHLQQECIIQKPYRLEELGRQLRVTLDAPVSVTA